MMHGTFNCKPHPRPRAALPPLLAALLWVGGCVFAGALLASGDANASDNDCDPAMSGCGLQPAGPISGPTPPAMPKKNVRETDGGNSLSNEGPGPTLPPRRHGSSAERLPGVHRSWILCRRIRRLLAVKDREPPSWVAHAETSISSPWQPRC